MAKKPGLGRGLDALLSSASKTSGEEKDDKNLRTVPVDQIRRGKYQPRIHIRPEALQELADSIRAQGLVQPVVLRPVDGGYELIAGERRWRAAQLAGMHEIPAVIRDIPDQAAAAMSLIENIQREDLNAMEEANALQRLINEFGLTHQQTADSVGRSRAAVSNLLRLLELTDEVKAMVDEGELEMGHGRALLALAAEDQIRIAKTIAKKGMSVRETERLVKRMLEGEQKGKTQTVAKNPDVVRLESDLGDRIGAAVSIQYNTKGKGKLVIEYNSLDELDGILEHIR
jgi:ParB family transcriptional regulator, chromosome partitioning protein